MVIVLSVFNGFDDIIKTLYNSVDPDFKIELKEGDQFYVDDNFVEKINNISGIVSYSEVLEHKMLAQNLDHQLVVDVKGIGPNYLKLNNLKDSIILGYFFNQENNFVVVGSKVFNTLSLQLLDFENPLQLSVFNKINKLDISNSIHTNSFYISGVFETHTELDNTYILLKIEDLREFLSLGKQCSSIELNIDNSVNYKTIEHELKHVFSDKFFIQNRFNQRPFIYKMVKTEKLAVYIIFSFILIVSMLSLISSLIVLLMEKQKDIQTLYFLGLRKEKIKSIFFIVGVLITIFGAFLGNILGLVFCFFQQKFGFFGLGESTSFIDSYPVKVNLFDIIIIQLIVLFLGALASYLVTKNKRFYNYS